jgi:hypothetical protein
MKKTIVHRKKTKEIPKSKNKVSSKRKATKSKGVVKCKDKPKKKVQKGCCSKFQIQNSAF